MPIESKAPEAAHSSEFYLENKAICEAWEDYTLQNGGTIDGSYTSWAIYFHGEIPKLNCSFQIQKSNIDNGSILIPAKKSIRKQSILLFSNVSLKASFIIRKKTFLDKIGLSSYKEVNQYYSTNSRGSTNTIEALLKFLKLYLDQKEIQEFFYNKTTKQFQITFNHLIESPSIIEEITTIIH